jgi:hypothetical protein
MVCPIRESTAMPRVVYLNAGIFDHPDCLAAVTDVAALHELVLIGARHPCGRRAADGAPRSLPDNCRQSRRIPQRDAQPLATLTSHGRSADIEMADQR